jgi:hypothetical protein
MRWGNPSKALLKPCDPIIVIAVNQPHSNSGNIPTGSPNIAANYGTGIIGETSETQKTRNQKVLKAAG